ncbi:C6 zinc finger domain protein [Saccharata proteae CBS 121410]|uniref:C6 zinc finger domain protein n=1 Tax=Saccharata proteae CBS 121410 TaxID=1314787 RepID=A0A9P4HP65_9PEZI|nr:C6 zinc finger domain protein [Saccharata proteae CBS 121410]
MPRRKAAERGQPTKSRSRNGCLTCRKRKIRCDEGRPVCGNCRGRNLECQRGIALKWEAEYTSRGLAFGRRGVWNKQKTPFDDVPTHFMGEMVEWVSFPRIQPYHFINSTIEGFEDVLAEQEELGFAFPQLEEQSHAPLFNYYLERFCPLTTPSGHAESPFASLVLPFSISASSNAINAVLAVAARHLSKINRAWKPVAMQLEGKVLRNLRKRITVEDPQRIALDPEVPTIMMMLCLFEIINKCDERWVVHLKGARDLIRNRRRFLPKSPADSLVAFSERFFAFHDVIGRTACGEAAIFGSDYWNAKDTEVDAWLGCSPELVSIVCAVTELSRLRMQDPTVSTKADFAIRAESLEHQLSNLVQVVREPEDETLRRSAEVKRLTAVIYLYCALHGASPTTLLVGENVREILQHFIYFLNQGVIAGLTWPLFVTAVELDTLEDEIGTDELGQPIYGRQLILKVLDRMSQSSVANISRTRSVISQVWNARELDECSNSLPSEDLDLRNDWERFVAPVSGNMSLA